MLHWVGRGGHMNTYQDGGISQGKISPVKHRLASLIFGIISPLVNSGHSDKYSYEISKPTLVHM